MGSMTAARVEDEGNKLGGKDCAQTFKVAQLAVEYMLHINEALEQLDKAVPEEYGHLRQQCIDEESEVKQQAGDLEGLEGEIDIKKKAVTMYEELIKREMANQKKFLCEVCKDKFFPSVELLEGHYARRHPDYVIRREKEAQGEEKREQKEGEKVNTAKETNQTEKEVQKVKDLIGKCEDSLDRCAKNVDPSKEPVPAEANKLESKSEPPPEESKTKARPKVPFLNMATIAPVSVERASQRQDQFAQTQPLEGRATDPRNRTIQPGGELSIEPKPGVSADFGSEAGPDESLEKQDTHEKEAEEAKSGVERTPTSEVPKEPRVKVEIVYQPRLRSDEEERREALIRAAGVTTRSYGMQTLYCLYHSEQSNVAEEDETNTDTSEDANAGRISRGSQTEKTAVRAHETRRRYFITSELRRRVLKLPTINAPNALPQEVVHEEDKDIIREPTREPNREGPRAQPTPPLIVEPRRVAEGPVVESNRRAEKSGTETAPAVERKVAHATTWARQDPLGGSMVGSLAGSKKAGSANRNAESAVLPRRPQLGELIQDKLQEFGIDSDVHDLGRV